MTWKADSYEWIHCWFSDSACWKQKRKGLTFEKKFQYKFPRKFAQVFAQDFYWRPSESKPKLALSALVNPCGLNAELKSKLCMWNCEACHCSVHVGSFTTSCQTPLFLRSLLVPWLPFYNPQGIPKESLTNSVGILWRSLGDPKRGLSRKLRARKKIFRASWRFHQARNIEQHSGRNLFCNEGF